MSITVQTAVFGAVLPAVFLGMIFYYVCYWLSLVDEDKVKESAEVPNEKTKLLPNRDDASNSRSVMQVEEMENGSRAAPMTQAAAPKSPVVQQSPQANVAVVEKRPKTGEELLLEKNEAVLYQIYLFYSEHAAAVKDARKTGISATTDKSHLNKSRSSDIDKYDQKLLSKEHLTQLMRDFQVMSSSGSSPAITPEWLDSEFCRQDSSSSGSISYREFCAILLETGKASYPSLSTGAALLRVLETMDL